jgi:hypothetical protein
MFNIHHDVKRFADLFSDLLEHGNFFNTSDGDSDLDNELQCWKGRLEFIPAPKDVAMITVESSQICLISSCGEHLIYAVSDGEILERYDVELYHGSCEQIHDRYQELLADIRSEMLEDWRKRHQA